MNFLKFVPRSAHILSAIRATNNKVILRNSAFNIKRPEYYIERVGTREMVGHGFNGNPTYFDWPEYPFPALRYKEVTPEIMALREKERGDWKLLTVEEKKQLYRASFCQTYVEFNARHGEWMKVLGYLLMLISLAIWIWIFIRLTLEHEVPITYSQYYRRAQTRRMIHLQGDPMFGMCSEWDYDKWDWKQVDRWTIPNPFGKCKPNDKTKGAAGGGEPEEGQAEYS